MGPLGSTQEHNWVVGLQILRMGNLWVNDNQYPLPGCSVRTPNIQGRYDAPAIKNAVPTSLEAHSELELLSMRGIT